MSVPCNFIQASEVRQLIYLGHSYIASLLSLRYAAAALSSLQP
jgi:hypothetical protein